MQSTLAVIILECTRSVLPNQKEGSRVSLPMKALFHFFPPSHCFQSSCSCGNWCGDLVRDWTSSSMTVYTIKMWFFFPRAVSQNNLGNVKGIFHEERRYLNAAIWSSNPKENLNLDCYPKQKGTTTPIFLMYLSPQGQKPTLEMEREGKSRLDIWQGLTSEQEEGKPDVLSWHWDWGLVGGASWMLRETTCNAACMFPKLWFNN